MSATNRNEYNKMYHRKRMEDPEYREHRNKIRRKFAQSEKGVLLRIRATAKKQGIPFNLTEEDVAIPDVCPVLGIPLNKNAGNGRNTTRDDSVSVDRLIPELGYVKGNVVVMSFKANRMKNNGTVEELKALVSFLENYKYPS